ncbi:MAG: DUF3467 domain-containing protein [Anaerolineales bacterium]|nr:DUF3467 domain-containing protein [Anaerolineales bacterium]
MSEVNKKGKKADEVYIKVKWGTADGIQTVYANQLYITHAAGEFYLVFGELAPLMELDKDNPPDSIEVVPVAKIAITPNSMQAFTRAMQDNIEKYSKRLEEKRE